MNQHKWQNAIKKLPGGSNGWTKKFRMKNKHKIEQLFEKQISTINLKNRNPKVRVSGGGAYFCN